MVFRKIPNTKQIVISYKIGLYVLSCKKLATVLKNNIFLLILLSMLFSLLFQINEMINKLANYIIYPAVSNPKLVYFK